MSTGTVATSAIVVRPLVASDCEAVCELVTDNGTRFTDAGLANLPTDAAEFGRWLPGSLAASGLQSLKVIYGIVVTERGQERLAGFVGIETLNRFHGVGVWYGLGRDFQGRGLAKTGVLSAMADFATRARAQKLASTKTWVLHALSRNARSIGLAESIGFEREEMLDYSRQTSARGGLRFSGYSLERIGASLAAEAAARVRAFSMGAATPMPEAANDTAVNSDAAPVRRRRARA